MKRSNLMFLVIGVAIIFSGCSKDNSIAPDSIQSDQETSLLKAQKIPFIGISTLVGPTVGGDTTFLPNGKVLIKGITVDWYDSSDDCDGMITGVSHWTMNSLTEPNGNAKIWGKAQIDVDGISGTGLWQLSWHGSLTLNPDGSGLVITCDANGQGKEGVVKGMTGKWTYTMNFNFMDPTTFFYATEGYIK